LIEDIHTIEDYFVFDRSMDCKWVIDSGDPDAKLLIDVTYVNIENSPGCAYDSLTIYDGKCSIQIKCVFCL